MTDITKTIIYGVLEKVPQNQGYVFSDVIRKGLLDFARSADIVPKSGLLTQYQETLIDEMAQGQKGKDAVRDKLVSRLGVKFESAAQIVSDGKLNRKEALEIMAEIGAKQCGTITPGKEAIETIGTLAKKNGITDPATHRALAQFELGMSDSVLTAFFAVNPYRLVGAEANLQLLQEHNDTHHKGIKGAFEATFKHGTIFSTSPELQDGKAALKEKLKDAPDGAQNIVSQAIRWLKEAADEAGKPEAKATTQRPAAP